MKDCKARCWSMTFSVLPDTPKLVHVSDRDTLNRVHNIFIDTAKARLYCGTITGFSTGQHSLGVYSLANPAKPVLVALIDGFDKTHDMYVRNDTAWCSQSNTGYTVLDMGSLPIVKILGGLWPIHIKDIITAAGWATTISV